MAVALKVRIFDTAKELADFAADVANNVTTIISIDAGDSSGKYVLFYT